jgi:hypothetical protein
MSWKRKSPGARRRRRLRRERYHWSYAYWLQVEKRLFAEFGLHGSALQLAARLAARYVVGGGNPSRLLEMTVAHAHAIGMRWNEQKIQTRAARVAGAPWSARVDFN